MTRPYQKKKESGEVTDFLFSRIDELLNDVASQVRNLGVKRAPDRRENLDDSIKNPTCKSEVDKQHLIGMSHAAREKSLRLKREAKMLTDLGYEIELESQRVKDQAQGTREKSMRLIREAETLRSHTRKTSLKAIRASATR